jgi:4-hydroxymandelate oxidase
MSLPPVECAQHYQALALAQLPPEIAAYLQDGDTAALAQAWSGVPLTPRPLARVCGGHTRSTLFGQVLDHPFILAPIAYQRLFHPLGEQATAMAAAAQGGQHIISSLASQDVADIVRAAREGGAAQAPWFQLYWQQDRPRTLDLLRRAEAAGCAAVVFTVDAPIKLATMRLPASVSAVNLAPPLPLPQPLPEGGASRVFDGWMKQAPTWDDLAWLRSQTRLPLLVKGVLHPDDAWQAVEAGCDGVVVSCHGGRVLAGALSPVDALPRVLDRIGGRVPVLVDSGIRSGRDAFVALSMGASAVLLGRPYVWGLAAHGAMGVAHVLRLLRDDLEMTMALMGCGTLDAVRASAGRV